MTELFQVTVKDTTTFSTNAYVYLIYSPDFKSIYIGQTRAKYGALQRLSQHLADHEGNTFQQKLCAFFDYEAVNLQQVEFAACPLSSRREFQGRARDYREAVEYLTQMRIIEFIRRHSVRVGCISHVAPNRYSKLSFVIDETERVVGSLGDWLLKVAYNDTN